MILILVTKQKLRKGRGESGKRLLGDSILGLIPGSIIIEKIINNIFFEFDSSNKVLWLYKP